MGNSVVEEKETNKPYQLIPHESDCDKEKIPDSETNM